MQQKIYFKTTAIIFLIIAVLHALRLAFGWHAEIGGWTVPNWLSWLALAIGGYLGYTGWILAQEKK